MRLTDSSKEYISPAGENAVPASEFPRSPENEFIRPPREYTAGDQSAASDRGRRRMLKHFMALPALILALAMFLTPADGAPVPSGPLPEPEPQIETYPLGDGQIQITVYNDTIIYMFPGDYTYDEDMIVTVLDQFTVSESEFTQYVLPEPRYPTGWIFRGWAVHYASPFDYGFRIMSYGGGEPAPGSLGTASQFTFTIGDVLTREDVERIPPSADGVRYVNIHAMWILEDPENTKNQIIFHDGDTEWSYGAETAAASEGFTYLAAFDVPEKEGYEFMGWYDEEGSKVEMLDYYVYFDSTQNSDGTWSYDWYHPHPVHLYARWKKI